MYVLLAYNLIVQWSKERKIFCAHGLKVQTEGVQNVKEGAFI